MKFLLVFMLGLIIGVGGMIYFSDRDVVRVYPPTVPVAASSSAAVGRSTEIAQPMPSGARPSSALPPAASSFTAQRSAAIGAAWRDDLSTGVAVPDARSAMGAPSPLALENAVPTPSVTSESLPTSAITGLLIPVSGISATDLADTFTQARDSGRAHDAIDIMALQGTPVVAANDGHVVKLFTSKPGGLTVYQFDPQNRVVYYYAHLDSYAPGLTEGQELLRGDLIGFVGSTGDASANAPHLHFEIELLGPEKQWWHATSINPYGRFQGQYHGQ